MLGSKTKSYTGVLNLELKFNFHAQGGNKDIMKQALRQQMYGLINDIRNAGLVPQDFDLDADGDEDVSLMIEDILKEVF